MTSVTELGPRGLTGVADAIPAGALVLLDTSVLLAHLSPTEQVGPIATNLVDGCLRAGRNPGAISTITVSELLVRPQQDGRHAVDTVLGFLWSIPDLLVRSVDFLVAAEASRIRASRQLTVPDSLILATGVLAGADILATNDRALAVAAPAAAPQLSVLLLSELSRPSPA